MMNLLLASLLVLQLAGTSTPAQGPREGAVIEGIVVRLDTGEPLRRAQLTLYQVIPPGSLAAARPIDSYTEPPRFPPIDPIMTEADGVFRFTKIPAGSYRLSVACNGYVSTSYGSDKGQTQGTIITIVGGQVIKDISLRLRPAATLSGHLRDSEGSPITGLSVSLLAASFYPNGLRAMEAVASSTTDDRGEYRLFWVSPGRYYLSAGISDSRYSLGNAVQEKQYPPFYYPGTFDIQRATMIDVLPGAEMGAMDIVMTRPKTYRIQGTIVDTGGGAPPEGVQIDLLPRSEGDVATIDYLNSGINNRNFTYASGAFEITNVLPGSYMMHASANRDFSAPLPADAVAAIRSPSDLFRVAFSSQSTAILPVEVSASDVSDLKMTLVAGVRVSLQIRLEGKELSSLPDYDKIRVRLQPRLNSWEGAVQQVSVNANGVGAIENAEIGEYRVVVEPMSPDFYIKEARIDDTDALNGFWKFSGTPTGVLNLVLADKPGSVEGTLTDVLSKPVAGVEVVLIPENHRHRFELYETVDTDDKGRFAFRGIAPGDYRVFSWEALEPNTWFDREVLAKYEPQGKLVHVTEASQQSVDIKIIPAPRD